MIRKKFEDLTIKDSFMFTAVMTDPDQGAELCRQLISRALDMEILEVTLQEEKPFIYRPDFRGVRLDVLAIEQGTRRRFNVEMQVWKDIAIPKRSRYYHSQMDMNALQGGHYYSELPDTYVIFICDFDPIGNALYRYTYESICRETGDLFCDGRKTVLLSTKGKNRDCVPKELSDLLDFIGNPENADAFADDTYIFQIGSKVTDIKRERTREGEYMLFEELMEHERKEGYEAGVQEGTNRMNRLIQILLEQQRLEDLARATNDPAFCRQLLTEFQL